MWKAKVSTSKRLALRNMTYMYSKPTRLFELPQKLCPQDGRRQISPAAQKPHIIARVNATRTLLKMIDLHWRRYITVGNDRPSQ